MRKSRRSIPLGLVLVGGLVGCTHNHYYYGAGDALPIESSAPVTLGRASGTRGQTVVIDESPARVVSRTPSTSRIIEPSLCDDGQTIVLSDPPPRVVRRSTPASGGSRVVISQPSRNAVAQSAGRDDWSPVTRSSRVDRLVSTQVEGEAETKERR